MQKYTLDNLQSSIPILPSRLTSRYNKYLLSDNWRRKRVKVLRRDGFRCTVCNEGNLLEIHHLSYDHVFVEKLSEVCTLCSKHHRMVHRSGNGDVEKEDIADVA